ncbi:ABC transporter permease [Arachidicoccus terrestris]|uniref:ABC transporter permease n=1 Tax=Arachidicoccus terrestris TaxID=2875539 RepID=UPI001CC5C108|nr:ABC transporter permease [Arachidicoccus terrestris]UAY56919.1 ABC transporter permease [Arachidicoccus terrestris]
MFKTYLKTAWRSLIKHKVNSIINITGLAIGLACSILIILYVVDELSYDRFFPGKEQIVRVNTDFNFGGREMRMAQSSDIMGPTLKKDYPQVEAYTRIYNNDGARLIKKGNEYFNEKRVASVDSTFFDVFQLPVIAGDARHALDKPGTVVVTASSAKKYFGTVDALGRRLEVKHGDSLKPFLVTAVIKDIPANSQFQFDFLFDMQDVQYNWGAATSHNFYTYLKLKKGTDYHAFEKHFPDYVRKYVLPYAARFIDVSSIGADKVNKILTYSLMPLTDVHLHSDRVLEISPGGNIQYVYIFSAVALFILLMACVNFINLTTARSGARAKEVGMRKVFGTDRKQLVFQFLLESIVMVVVAMVFALLIDFFAIPGFNQLAGKSLHFSTLFTPAFLVTIVLLPLLVGFIAGIYPAFFLSGFRPVQVLKGKLKMGGRSGKFRNGLVVFQFSISIVLIIATIVVYRQLHYIQTKNIGFVKDQVLILNETGPLGDHAEAFKNELLKMPEIKEGTFSAYLPVSNSFRGDNTYSTAPVMTSTNGFSMQNWKVDEDYISTLGMQLIKGRNFSRDFVSDSTAVVINETTAKYLGAGDPIGKYLYSTDNKGNVLKYHVIGVLKNFNYESLHSNIGPLGLFLKRSPYTASFKISTSDIAALIGRIKHVWEKFAPGMPFSYRFLDDSFNDMYQAETRAGTTSIVFSSLAIFIACLGLFGLAMFAVEQRTKEIGIRKVLGASNVGIVQLLSREFVFLVLLAFVIAAPIAWFFMHSWLQEFAFRTNIAWWIFVVAGGAALFIALVTVSFQSVKAALANPVKVLKAE